MFRDYGKITCGHWPHETVVFWIWSQAIKTKLCFKYFGFYMESILSWPIIANKIVMVFLCLNTLIPFRVNIPFFATKWNFVFHINIWFIIANRLQTVLTIHSVLSFTRIILFNLCMLISVNTFILILTRYMPSTYCVSNIFSVLPYYLNLHLYFLLNFRQY